MKKTFKHVSKESKAKWDKGLKQLRDAIVEPIEGGFIPPDVRTFEEPLTECEKEGAVEISCDRCARRKAPYSVMCDGCSSENGFPSFLPSQDEPKPGTKAGDE